MRYAEKILTSLYALLKSKVEQIRGAWIDAKPELELRERLELELEVKLDPGFETEIEMLHYDSASKVLKPIKR